MIGLIRFILTMVLIYLVYLETGVWTSISLGLTYFTLYLNDVSHGITNKDIKYLKSFAELSGYRTNKDRGLD